MGRVGRWPATIDGGSDGERIVAFAQGGKPPGNRFFRVGLDLGDARPQRNLKPHAVRVFDPGGFFHMALISKLSGKKREARKSLSQPGWITLEGGFAARQCVVKDLSTTGAKVTIDDPNSLPAKLRLAFSRDARTGRRCEVVWRRGNSVGVKFVR
jgi:hypothetical protein